MIVPPPRTLRTAARRHLDVRMANEGMLLPVRYLCATALMTVLYPPTLGAAMGRAIYQRLAKGTPDLILPSGKINPLKAGGGYAGQMYFSKPLDADKLTSALASMCADMGIPEEAALCEFIDGDPPRGHEGSLGWSEVTPGPKGVGSAWLEGWSMGELVLKMRAINGDASNGGVSVLQFNLPGGAWDGSSCFNFMKELIHRYCDGTPNDVFRTLKLIDKAAKSLRGEPGAFVQFLLRLPANTFFNLRSYVWSAICSAPSAFGGPGLGLRGALLNLTPEESSKLAAGLRKRGASPFAGLVFSAVSGHREVLGTNPHGVVQQASLVTAAYEPYIAERNVVGDFLVGPLQRIRAHEEYTLATSQEGYEKLRAELATCSGAVRRSFEAKAYGLLNGGAAAFEAPPTYGDDLRLMDSIFFNNYGQRAVHEDAGCIGWNWGAPFKLGVNCIFVNGRTCMCFASSVLSNEELSAIRDHAHKELRGFMV